MKQRTSCSTQYRKWIAEFLSHRSWKSGLTRNTLTTRRVVWLKTNVCHYVDNSLANIVKKQRASLLVKYAVPAVTLWELFHVELATRTSLTRAAFYTA